MKITIVGAGISGLATAHTLGTRKHSIEIIAKDFTPCITSDRAAAFWFPYHIRNDQRGIHWCKRSYEVYHQLSRDPSSGVSMQNLLKVVRPGVQEQETTWCSFMPEGSYRILEPHEIPAGYAIAYNVQVPLIETQIFLPWLMSGLQQMNVTIVKNQVQSLDEIVDTDVIVNCSALGARQLCDDTSLVPRKDAIIVGGTYEEGITEAVTESATVIGLLDRAYNVFPELRDQQIIGSWAGIRPYRPLVRVEKEGKIIHNYGHGGSGFTLAWGCAAEVASLIEEQSSN